MKRPPTKVLGARVPADLAEQVIAAAENNGQTVTEYITEALTLHIHGRVG